MTLRNVSWMGMIALGSTLLLSQAACTTSSDDDDEAAAGSGGQGGSSGSTSAGGSSGSTSTGGSSGSTSTGGSSGSTSTGGSAGAGGSTGGAGGATGGAGGATGGAGGATGGAGGATGGAGGATGGSGGATGGTGGATGGTGGTGGASCIDLTIDTFTADAVPYAFSAEVTSPELGTTTGTDLNIIQMFLTSTVTGFDLSTRTDLTTCGADGDVCVSVWEDAEIDNGELVASKLYFQSMGTVDVTRLDNQLVPHYSAGSLSDVTLVEVDSSGAPVTGGACLNISSASWDITDSCVDGGLNYSGGDPCGDCNAAETNTNGCCAAETDACLADTGLDGCATLSTCSGLCSDQSCLDTCRLAADQNAQDLYDAFTLCTQGDGDADGMNPVGACGIVCGN